MKETKLKPCPFCGGEAEIVEKKTNFPTTTIVCVECKECFASPYIHDKYSDYYDSDWVVEQWNRRADNETVRHGKWLDTRNISYSVRCSVCGGYSSDETFYCPHCDTKMDGGDKSE